MAIVCWDYYLTQYMGEPISAEEFPRAEAKAERLIDQITHGRAAKFAALPIQQQEAVRAAVCAQIEYYALQGADISVNGSTSGNGWTVGKVRVNGSNGAWTGRSSAASMVCAAAIAALEQTGLLNPQAPTLGEPPLVGWPWEV